jgi:hypothetical protein
MTLTGTHTPTYYTPPVVVKKKVFVAFFLLNIAF